MTSNTPSESKPAKSDKKRGRNYGHHSGLHGDARKARTKENKARRAAARLRRFAKRATRRAAIESARHGGAS